VSRPIPLDKKISRKKNWRKIENFKKDKTRRKTFSKEFSFYE
jgi:hypothetical protein